MLLQPPAWLPALMPEYLWRGPSQQQQLYLTFDDGPTPGVTDWVLDLLAKHQAKATFFCVGDAARRNPALAQRIVAEGHALGNHTHTHKAGLQTSLTGYLRDVQAAQETLSQITGVQPRLFRPPYGRLWPSQATALRALGYRVVLWSALAGDWSRRRSPERCLSHLMPHLTPGSILVLHDSAKAVPTLRRLLPQLLHHAEQRGLRPQALPL